MIDVDIEQAIKLLDGSTSYNEIEKLKYISGFNRGYVIEQIQEAMDLGAEALRKQIELQDKINILSLPYIDDDVSENIRYCVINSLKTFCIGKEDGEKRIT